MLLQTAAMQLLHQTGFWCSSQAAQQVTLCENEPHAFSLKLQPCLVALLGHRMAPALCATRHSATLNVQSGQDLRHAEGWAKLTCTDVMSSACSALAESYMLDCCRVMKLVPGHNVRPCLMLQAARAAQEEALQSKQDSAELQRDLRAARAQVTALEGSLAAAQAGLAEAQAAAQEQHQEVLGQRDAAHQELARQLQASQDAVRGLQQELAQAQVQLAGLRDAPRHSAARQLHVHGSHCMARGRSLPWHRRKLAVLIKIAWHI